jgi:HD superfamily phosphohydrolase
LFFSGKDIAKLDVLESKLSIYEDLSREMLAKLESAVDKISEANSQIANILVKHDERIEQSAKTDELIIKMLEEYKKQSEEVNRKISVRIEKNEKKIDELSTFRWKVGGVVGVLLVMLTITSSIAAGFLSSGIFNKTIINENIEDVISK